MKLTAFVLYITNPHNLKQEIVYNKYLRQFDVVDAVMCNNGECLATCVSQLNTNSNQPVCYERFVLSVHNDNVCTLTILDLTDYEHMDILQNLIYHVIETYNIAM
ncbi:AC117 [Trabala vishnou gigantina nucleopolyhedrovirus]|uniref:AC117 n=1 Tax=Trabala vishnou gigantina nucleopolyhedrovirus TaxID=2863583 RepID=UPI002481E3A7|nr:AC117 [Trabala vishnou gigantina nucleopolyhedrovirus]QYC92773.1 AC117 [Trabala vishnou gigantina nucleopolyhedrovirus]